VAALQDFGQGGIEWSAAAQQLALIVAVHYDRRAQVEEMLSVDGSILRWVHRADTWPPSYTVIQSGNNRFFIAINGTTNIRQGIGHIQGSFGRQYPDDAPLANGQWLNVWQTMREEIAAVLPTDLSHARIYLSGHSYGAAVAALGALEYSRTIHRDNVGLITFGSPKVMGVGYRGVRPNGEYRIYSPGDIVATLPPSDGTENVVERWASPIAFRLGLPFYTHYGEKLEIYPDGSLNSGNPPPNPLPPGVSFGNIAEHSFTNYWGRLNARRARSGSTNTTEGQALALTAAILSIPDTQVLTESLPTSVPGPSGEMVSVPLYATDTPSFASNIGVSLMPDFTKLVDGKPMKVTLFFNAGRQGWTESFLGYVKGSSDPYATAYAWAHSIGKARRAIMASSVSIEAIRTSDDTLNRESDLVFQKGPGIGEGLKTGNAAPAVMGWLMRLEDPSNYVFNSRIFRGLPNVYLPTLSNAGPFPATVPDDIQQFKDALVSLMVPPNPVNGLGNIQGAMRTYDRASTKGIVTRFQVSDTGHLQVQLAGDIRDTIAVGMKVSLAHRRTRGVRGVAGVREITDYTFESGKTTITFRS